MGSTKWRGVAAMLLLDPIKKGPGRRGKSGHWCPTKFRFFILRARILGIFRIRKPHECATVNIPRYFPHNESFPALSIRKTLDEKWRFAQVLSRIVCSKNPPQTSEWTADFLRLLQYFDYRVQGALCIYYGQHEKSNVMWFKPVLKANSYLRKGVSVAFCVKTRLDY